MNREICRTFISLLVIALSACSSTNGKTASTPAMVTGGLRRLASLGDANEVDAAAFNLALASDSRQKLTESFDRYVRLYFRARGYLDDFDKKLNEPGTGDLFAADAPTGPAYARIMAARILMDQIEHSLEQSYLGAANAELSLGLGLSQDSEKLQEFASVFSQVLRRPGTDRLALQGLYQGLIGASDQLQAYLGQSASQLASLKIQTVSDAASALSLKAAQATAYAKSHATELKSRIDLAQSDDEIGVAVEKLVPGVQESFSRRNQGREPQSQDFIAPSAGRAGLVSGYEFPAGTWALTFDDGPHYFKPPDKPPVSYTLQILQNLQAHQLRATFFIVMKMALAAPTSLLGSEKAALMGQGHHTYHHPNLTELQEGGWQTEIVNSSDQLWQMIGPPRMKFFRCPYGACGEPGSRIRQLIAQSGMIAIGWDVDPMDWLDDGATSQTICSRVINQMNKQEHPERGVPHGGIILMHDIKERTIAASACVMDEFVRRARAGTLHPMTVEQEINELNGVR